VRWPTALTRVVAWSVLLGVAIGCGIGASPGVSRVPTSSIRLTDTRPSLDTSLTVTPSPSPAPLSQDAIASCPVTVPNGKRPLDEMNADFNHGNEAGTLFTIPWPSGKVTFRPGGPGFIEPDGSLLMKWPWYRQNIKGQVIVKGRRLDAPAPPIRASMGCCRDQGTPVPGCCYGNTGFIPSGLIFPTEGCWEVTARVGNDTLTFVTLAIKVAQ
jgi:hypothetical protein